MIQNETLQKYPRTPHVRGSKLQKGDDANTITIESLAGKYVVIEEKVDGANAGFSFTSGGDLRLQCRGHYLTGGGRESQFGQFKSWVSQFEGNFLERFEDRYLVFGEWMYEKHTIYYDRLPHLFLEFDIWDRKEQAFLSTAARHALCQDLPIAHVPVLYEGPCPSDRSLRSMVGPSAFKTPSWEASLLEAAELRGIPEPLLRQQTLWDQHMEGLYLKVETPEHTIGRAKWVRPDFVQTIVDSNSHHQDRILVPNKLEPGINIFHTPHHQEWTL